MLVNQEVRNHGTPSAEVSLRRGDTHLTSQCHRHHINIESHLYIFSPSRLNIILDHHRLRFHNERRLHPNTRQRPARRKRPPNSLSEHLLLPLIPHPNHAPRNPAPSHLPPPTNSKSPSAPPASAAPTCTTTRTAATATSSSNRLSRSATSPPASSPPSAPQSPPPRSKSATK